MAVPTAKEAMRVVAWAVATVARLAGRLAGTAVKAVSLAVRAVAARAMAAVVASAMAAVVGISRSSHISRGSRNYSGS